MKSLGFTAAFGTALLLLTSVADAKHDNVHANLVSRRHKHHHNIHTSRADDGEEVAFEVQKRGGQCQFPSDAGLVAVAPGSQNAGWAMSPDEPCKPGNYCPYACPPGQVMAQWDPDATSYSYPQSMNGGLFCDKDGNIKKPFPNKPYCVDGTGSVGCKNKAKGQVAFCQTVLPGNEAMLIPTSIEDAAELAVPGPEYWCGTAAHFYINPPGVSTEEACVWGSKDNPWGNWSPYVAGANTDKTGNTFVKLAWNPIYLEPATPFRDKMPTWGVEIVCEGGGCNGLPCAIDPSKHSVNEISGGGTVGVGGASFCVVTVPKGSKANFVVFEGKSSGGSSGGSSPSSAKPSSSPSPPPSSSPAPSSSPSTQPSSSSSSSSPPPPPPPSPSSTQPSSAPSKPSSSGSSSPPISSSPINPSSTSSSSGSAGPSLLPPDYFDSKSGSTTSPESAADQTTSSPATTTTEDSTSGDDTNTNPTDTSSSAKFAYSPHILVENSTATSSFMSASMSAKSTQSLATSVTASSTTTTNSKSAAQVITSSTTYSCLSLILALFALGL